MSSLSQLPQTPEKVTPEWLTAALDERHPGVRVRSVDVLEIHHGTNSNARLGVTYEGDTDLPETFFLKMLPLDPERRKTINDTGMGRREALFYRHLAGDVPMRVPRPYVARLDEHDGSFVLLLEDLGPTDCTLADPTKGLEVAQVAAAMEDYAKLHVRFAEDRVRTERVPWLEPMNESSDMGIWMLQFGLDHHRDKLRDPYAEMAQLYIDQRPALDGAV